jgi:hypothetical protein
MLPSDLRMPLWFAPAAICDTVPEKVGTLHWPNAL